MVWTQRASERHRVLDTSVAYGTLSLQAGRMHAQCSHAAVRVLLLQAQLPVHLRSMHPALPMLGELGGEATRNPGGISEEEEFEDGLLLGFM
jgi:hypothetical protein